MITYLSIIIFSLILLLSFVFSMIQKNYKISAVILLIASGILSQQILKYLSIDINIPHETLSVFGTVGLMVIVLEAVMDMEISHHNIKTINKAIIFSIILVPANAILMAWGFIRFYHLEIVQALAYAIPLSIVSSAIVIPSLRNTKTKLAEFLILESIFSDIIGVLAFDFIASADPAQGMAILPFMIKLFFMVIISIFTTLLLGFLLSKRKTKHQAIVMLAILMLIYGLAKIFHLSALLLIVIFGLCLRNLPSILTTKYGYKLRYFLDSSRIKLNLKLMHEYVDEFGFVIRSIFFVLLGFSINLSLFKNFDIILLGIMVAVAIYATRWALLYLFVSEKNLLLSTTMAPRGLITVLLFFQIPEKYQFAYFHGGITFLIVVTSGVIMSLGMVASEKQNTNS